ncbi:hypothetical protein B0H16DRAFT_1238677, partial [Mycena metata]
SECWQEEKKTVDISKSMLDRRIKGGCNQKEGHKHQAWLTKEETDTVADFTAECLDRGFPLSHRRLKEHVDEITQARLGDFFPAEGVGRQWTHKFVSDNIDRL